MMKSLGSSKANYQYVITATAKRDIDRLAPAIKRAIGLKLKEFLDSGDPLHFAKRLIDSKIGTFRFRVGDYRVTFDLEGENIVVLRVRNRRDIYK
jgi:mRNA interferase RelE/StbE